MAVSSLFALIRSESSIDISRLRNMVEAVGFEPAPPKRMVRNSAY